MTREIKFRAWDGKVMSKPFNLEWYKRGTEKPEDWEDVGLSVSGGNGYWDDNAIFMQFTGLLDKNGKEIYEGDIITNGNILVDGENPETGQIIWDEPMASFACVSIERKDGHRYYQSFDSMRVMEVIGNIYQNPELIK